MNGCVQAAKQANVRTSHEAGAAWLVTCCLRQGTMPGSLRSVHLRGLEGVRDADPWTAGAPPPAVVQPTVFFGGSLPELPRSHERNSLAELREEARTTFERVLEEGFSAAGAAGALDRCATLLSTLRDRLLAGAAEGCAAHARYDMATHCWEYRRQFEGALTRLYNSSALAFTADDEVSMAAVVYIFDLFVAATFAKGHLLAAEAPPPLNTADVLSPLVESLLPFCEGYVEYKIPGTGVWLRRWLVLDRQRLLWYRCAGPPLAGDQH